MKKESSKVAKTTGIKIMSKGVSKQQMASMTCCHIGSPASK